MRKAKTIVTPDEYFDEPLCQVMGDHYLGEVIPVEAEEIQQIKDTCTNILEAVKRPVLFTALIAFMAWAAHAGLMDPVIAIPGMCVCSGCVGYQLRK